MLCLWSPRFLWFILFPPKWRTMVGWSSVNWGGNLDNKKAQILDDSREGMVTPKITPTCGFVTPTRWRPTTCFGWPLLRPLTALALATALTFPWNSKKRTQLLDFVSFASWTYRIEFCGLSFQQKYLPGKWTNVPQKGTSTSFSKRHFIWTNPTVDFQGQAVEILGDNSNTERTSKNHQTIAPPPDFVKQNKNDPSHREIVQNHHINVFHFRGKKAPAITFVWRRKA